MTAWWALVVGPAIAAVLYLSATAYVGIRRAPLADEWGALQERVDAARADFEDVRAHERETLIERIARDELAGFFASWQERVES